MEVRMEVRVWVRAEVRAEVRVEVRVWVRAEVRVEGRVWVRAEVRVERWALYHARLVLGAEAHDAALHRAFLAGLFDADVDDLGKVAVRLQHLDAGRETRVLRKQGPFAPILV